MPARHTNREAASLLSRVACWIMLPLLAGRVRGCTSSMDSASGTVVITGMEQTSTDPGAQPQAGTEQQAIPTQPTLDSLAAQLSDITAAQQLILSRLDAMEQGGTVAAAQADTAGVALDLEEATEEVRSLGVGIFWSLVIIVVFHFLIRALAWILETMAERSVRRRLTFKWLIPITRMALWAIAAYLILRTVFRVDAQGLLAASAALGLALGIAAQDLLKNVFGGPDRGLRPALSGGRQDLGRGDLRRGGVDRAAGRRAS